MAISIPNIEFVQQKPKVSVREIINKNSQDDKLITVGLHDGTLKQKEVAPFNGYENIGQS